MTCKDCLHYQVCMFVADMSDEEREAENVENDCSQFFKDRTKWVEQKHGRWIPVTEETPKETKDVLLRIKSKTTGMMAVTVGYCYTYYWCHQPVGLRWFERWRASYEPAGGNLDESWDVTHWMPLPEEQKEETE